MLGGSVVIAIIFLIAGVGAACFGGGAVFGDRHRRYRLAHCGFCKDVKICPSCAQRAASYDPVKDGAKGIEKRGAATPATFADIKTPWKTA